MSAAEYAVESGWLVEVVSEHTCGTSKDGHYGAHEPGCGAVPVARIDDLLHQQTGWRLYNELVDRWNPERMHLQSVIAELKSLLTRACGADAATDCHFDHGGDCQAHGPWGDGEPCPYPLIRQYLPSTLPVPGECLDCYAGEGVCDECPAACDHEWLDRPESDTHECLICGEERSG